jgi:lipoprotein NlpI
MRSLLSPAVAGLVLLAVSSPVLADTALDRNSAVAAKAPRGELARVDLKDPAPRSRGAKNQSTGELERIIAAYNAAINSNPKDDDAYFHRGIANFYAGSLSKALADMSKANELDPTYPYYAIWLDILGQHGNLPSPLAQATAQFDMGKWPAPLVRLYLGETTPDAVLAAAEDRDPVTKQGQVCEANFYIGQLALRQGSKEEAVRRFRLAAQNCPGDFVEEPAAGAELRALTVELRALTP